MSPYTFCHHTLGGYYLQMLAMDVYLLSSNQSFMDSIETAGSGDLQPTSTTVSPSPTVTRPFAGDIGSGQVALTLPTFVVLLVPLVSTVFTIGHCM